MDAPSPRRRLFLLLLPFSFFFFPPHSAVDLIARVAPQLQATRQQCIPGATWREQPRARADGSMLDR